jgi:hypothetical protein
MPECRTVCHLVSLLPEKKSNNAAGTGWYWTKPTPSVIFWSGAGLK